MKNEKGFSLIETFVALAIMFFVIAAILSGFSNQLALDRKNDQKNLAVALAESTMEEYLQMSSLQITATPSPKVDYYVEGSDHKLKPYIGTPPVSFLQQMKRTVTWQPFGRTVTINVRVEYFVAPVSKGPVYRFLFNVNLDALRGV